MTIEEQIAEKLALAARLKQAQPYIEQIEECWRKLFMLVRNTAPPNIETSAHEGLKREGPCPNIDLRIRTDVPISQEVRTRR